MVAVAIPADSMKWAIALTARVQLGQTGVSNTRSTASRFSKAATSFALCS